MLNSDRWAKTLILAIGIVAINFSLHAESLKDYLWKNRIIISFSNTKSNPDRLSLKKHVNEFQCEFKVRDLIHIDLIQGSDDYEFLSKKFSIANTKFKLLLLGKDGEVKLESANPSLVEVFTQIDAMPMRQREKQNQSTGTKSAECPNSSLLKN